MTTPLAHKAAIRNSCQGNFMLYHPQVSIHAAQTFSGVVAASFAGQQEEESSTFPSRSLAPQTPQQCSCSSSVSAQSCGCSPSASPPLTLTVVQRKANIPAVSLGTILKPGISFFYILEAMQNPKPTQGTVTLV